MLLPGPSGEECVQGEQLATQNAQLITHDAPLASGRPRGATVRDAVLSARAFNTEDTEGTEEGDAVLCALRVLCVECIAKRRARRASQAARLSPHSVQKRAPASRTAAPQ